MLENVDARVQKDINDVSLGLALCPRVCDHVPLVNPADRLNYIGI